MPSTTDALRNRMDELFGDPIDDAGPISYLEKRGFYLTPAFEWCLPSDVGSWAEMSPDEKDCMNFLCDEWDFGGLEYNADI